jgi:hypothetical protein
LGYKVTKFSPSQPPFQIGQLLGICLHYWIEHGVLDDTRLHLVGEKEGWQFKTPQNDYFISKDIRWVLKCLATLANGYSSSLVAERKLEESPVSKHN